MFPPWACTSSLIVLTVPNAAQENVAPLVVVLNGPISAGAQPHSLASICGAVRLATDVLPSVPRSSGAPKNGEVDRSTRLLAFATIVNECVPGGTIACGVEL